MGRGRGEMGRGRWGGGNRKGEMGKWANGRERKRGEEREFHRWI